MKTIKIVVLFLTINFSALAQENKRLFFSDNNNAPIEDVQVYINRIDLIAVSSYSGRCEIHDSITEIRCIYFGFKDTTIFLGNNKICDIKLDDKVILLENVDVSAQYDANVHLSNLFQTNSKKRNVRDTTVYYSFKIEYEIPELNQKEIMKGIIRHNYIKDANNTMSYICKLDLYSNTIKDKEGAEPYDYIQMYLDNKNVVRYSSKSEKKRKKDIEVLRSQDTTLFVVKYLDDEVRLDNFYFGFINNKNIYFFEESFETKNVDLTTVRKLAKPIKYVDTQRKYNRIEYVRDDNMLYPKSIHRLYEYNNVKNPNKPVKMVMRVSAQTIPNPNLETELRVRVFGNTTEYMQDIKENYPDLVIPNKE